MAEKNWSTVWPDAIDTVNELKPVEDDDLADPTQLNTIGLLFRNIEAQLGKTNPDAGSIKARLADLEQAVADLQGSVGNVAVEDEYQTTGLEAPEVVIFINLSATPRGGTFTTPSGYDLAVYRNGVRLRYKVSPTNQYEYDYLPGTNQVRFLASGNIDDLAVAYTAAA